MRDRIVIANCGGFWGDDPTAPRRQVEGGPIDYLVMDYLAEVTMTILQKQRQRRPTTGFAADVITHLRDVLPTCADRGIKITTNAGGVNPSAAKDAIEALADELGLSHRIKVGVVLGDDIYDRLPELTDLGEPFTHMDTGAPFTEVVDRVRSANVYIGAAPIVRALELGADIVVCGRVTDAAVTLAPMMYEFAWPADAWDKLAAGMVAGHIIECGTQCTGGNHTDWERVKTFSNLGFPLVEASSDGTFVVTKHPGTGGLVSVHTVTEQLLYEIGGPGYLSPDCVARFDTVQLTEVGPDRVKVSGVRGGPAPERLKVAVTFGQGYRAFGRLIVSGPDSVAKAKVLAETCWESAGGEDIYAETCTRLVGWDGTHPPLNDVEPNEITLHMAVRDDDREKIESRFCLQIVPRGLGCVPGITAFADQGRPRVSDVVGFWPTLISRDHVSVEVLVGDTREPVPHASQHGTSAIVQVTERQPAATSSLGGPTTRVPLSRLCLARSGDKGNTANIGLVARSEPVYDWMLSTISPEFVRDRFADLCHGDVKRIEFPNVSAVNFVLTDSLGGGGTMSLLVDSQGKTFGQYLLACLVDIPQAVLDSVQTVS